MPLPISLEYSEESVVAVRPLRHSPTDSKPIASNCQPDNYRCRPSDRLPSHNRSLSLNDLLRDRSLLLGQFSTSHCEQYHHSFRSCRSERLSFDRSRSQSPECSLIPGSSNPDDQDSSPECTPILSPSSSTSSSPSLPSVLSPTLTPGDAGQSSCVDVPDLDLSPPTLSQPPVTKSLLPGLLAQSSARSVPRRRRRVALPTELLSPDLDPLSQSHSSVLTDSASPVVIHLRTSTIQSPASKRRFLGTLAAVISQKLTVFRLLAPLFTSSPPRSRPRRRTSPTSTKSTRQSHPNMSQLLAEPFQTSDCCSDLKSPLALKAFTQYASPYSNPDEPTVDLSSDNCAYPGCLMCFPGELIALRTFVRRRGGYKRRRPCVFPVTPCIPGSIQEDIHQKELQNCWLHVDPDRDDQIMLLANFLPVRLGAKVRQSLSLPQPMKRQMLKHLSTLYVHRYVPAPRERSDDTRQLAIARAHAASGRDPIKVRAGIYSRADYHRPASDKRESPFFVLSSQATSSSSSAALSLGLGGRCHNGPPRAGIVSSITGGAKPVVGRTHITGTPTFGHAADIQWTCRGVPPPYSRWESAADVDSTRPPEEREHSDDSESTDVPLPDRFDLRWMPERNCLESVQILRRGWMMKRRPPYPTLPPYRSAAEKE